MPALLPTPTPVSPRPVFVPRTDDQPLPSPVELLDRMLARPAKTDADVTLLEHSSHILQVLRWAFAQMPDVEPREQNVVCLAGALHDLGKAVTAPTGKRWFHAGMSARLVPVVLQDPMWRSILAAADLDVDLTPVEVQQVITLVHEHHALSLPTMLQVPSAPLLPVADAIASALIEGYAGQIRDILSYKYAGLLATLLDHLDRAPWLAATELHEIALPHDALGDLLLTEHLLEQLRAPLAAAEIAIVMRGAGRVWVAGSRATLDAVLASVRVTPRDVLDLDACDLIYTRGSMPRLPRIDVPQLGYLLANPRTACRAIQDLFERRAVATRTIFEAEGLAFPTITSGVPNTVMDNPVALADLAYRAIRQWAVRLAPVAKRLLPPQHAQWLAVKQTETRTRRQELETAIVARHPDRRAAVAEILSLIGRYPTERSISLVVLQWDKVQSALDDPTAAFTLDTVADVDGVSPLALQTTADVACAVCGLRPPGPAATALLHGATHGDSRWASAGHRRRTAACAWCQATGLVTLPLASIRKEGTRTVRELNYVMVESAFSRARLAAVLQEFGFLDANNAERAVAKAAPDPGLSDADRAWFESIQGRVPERQVPRGIARLQGSLPVRQAVGLMLPGDTPLASRAIFLMPSATLFGLAPTEQMNSTVLEMVLLGLVATLRQQLGAARFTVEASSQFGTVRRAAHDFPDADLQWAQAALALAELRRRTCRHPQIHQDRRAFDLGFMLDVAAKPRETVSRLIRTIMNTSPRLPRATRVVEQLTNLVDMMTAAKPEPTSGLMQAIVRDLMAAGVVPDPDSLYARKEASHRVPRFKDERELCGALKGLWDVVDIPSLERWSARTCAAAAAAGPAETAPTRIARAARAARRIADYARTQQEPLRDVRARLVAENHVAVLSASAARSRARRAQRPLVSAQALLSVAAANLVR